MKIVFNAFFRSQGDTDKENKIIYIYIYAVFYTIFFVIFEYPSLYRYEEFILIVEINIQASKYIGKIFVIFCAIWYHLYILRNKKNTHGGVLLFVKLQAVALCQSKSHGHI